LSEGGRREWQGVCVDRGSWRVAGRSSERDMRWLQRCTADTKADRRGLCDVGVYVAAVKHGCALNIKPKSQGERKRPEGRARAQCSIAQSVSALKLASMKTRRHAGLLPRPIHTHPTPQSPTSKRQEELLLLTPSRPTTPPITQHTVSYLYTHALTRAGAGRAPRGPRGGG
jgi:hypothetical protein